MKPVKRERTSQWRASESDKGTARGRGRETIWHVERYGPMDVRVEGDVGEGIARKLGEAIAENMPPGPGRLTLDLDGLELVGGLAVAEFVSALRDLLSRGIELTLVGAPQMLAHTLYKAGLMKGERLSLIRPRTGEPFE